MDDYLDELLDERAAWHEPLGDEPEADDGIELHVRT